MILSADDTKEAIQEAKRFILKAEASLRALKDRSNNRLVYISGSKETGACKRASMDLTRALSNLRRSPPTP